MPTTAEILKLLRRASIGIGYKDRQSGPYTTPAAYQALLSGFYGSPARFPANMGVGVNAALSFAAGQGVSTTMPVLYQGAKGATVIITKTTVNGQSTYQLMVDGIDTGNGEGFRDIKDVAGQNGGIPSQQIADINAAIVQLRQVEGLGAAPIVFDYALGHSHGAATIVDYARANPTMFRNLELYDPQGTVRRFAGTDPLVSYNIGVQAIATTSDFLSMGFSESGTEGLSPLMMWEAGVGLWNNVWLSLPANAGRTILNDYTPLSQYGGMNYSHTWDSLGALIHDAGYDTAPSGWTTPLWNEKAMAYARADVGGLSHNVDGSVRFTERWETSTKLFQNIAAAAISAVGPRKLQAGVGLYDINPTYVNGNSIFNLNVTYTSTDGAVVVTVATTLSVNGIYADTASALNTGTASVVGRNVTLTSGGRTLTSNITGSSAGGQQTVVLSDANGSVTMPFSFDAEGGATPKGSMVMTGTSGRTLAAQFVRGLAPTLADALVPNDKLGNAVTNVVLTVALNNLAAAINNGGRVDASKAASTATDAAASSISAQLGAALRQNIIGSASSYLTAELGEALGLHGFGAELFGTVGNSVFSSVLSNVYTTSSTSIFGGFHVDQLFKSSNWSQALDSTTLGKGISAFVGAKLGASIVAPQTKAGLVLSQLGSSFGSMLISAGLSSTVGAGVTGLGMVGTAANAIGATLSQAFGAYANFIAPGVGALIGFVLGALIGNLFGRKKPRVPTANAETVLQIPYAHYELGAVTTANGGSRDLVTNMALGARDTLNELISLITAGGENGPTYVSNLYSPTQKYGHTGGQVWVEIGGQHKNVASADEAVEKGVLYAIKSTKIVGGDLFIKRLINNNSPESILELMGGIQAARDYAKYARELTAINAIISADPGGAFAASWLVTFNQISELKINQFSTSDFYGGLQGFLSSFDLKGHGVAFENVRISAQGNSAEIQARGQTSDGVFSILPQAMDGASDNDVLNARFQNNMQGWDTQTWQVGNYLRGVDMPGWSGGGNDSFWQYMGGTPTTGAVIDTRSDFMVSQAGVAYESTVRAAQHRGAAQLFVQFYDANFNAIGAYFASGFGQESGSSQGALSTYNLLSVTATAPAGTAYRKIGLRLTATGGGDPYAFFTQPTSRAVGGPAIDWTVKGEAVRIDDLSLVGYGVRPLGGATSGNDLIDQRLAVGGVTIDDSHTESRWVPPNYHIPDDEGHYVSVTVDGGDDIFVGGAGNDVLYGRSGWDWLDGGGGDDVIYGGEQNDVLIGGTGNDLLFGEGGDDYLAAGDGADGVYGGTGNDILADGQGSECLLGEDGDDTFLITEDYTFNWFWGGTQDPNSDPNGKDTISAERLGVGVAFDLDYRPPEWNGHPDVVAGDPRSRMAAVTNAATGAWITNEGLLGIENATGSNYNDRLYGTVGDNVLKGLAGDDQIWGRDGNDTIEGGAGADAMAGEGGFDRLSYAGSSAGVYVDLSTGEAFGGDADGDTFSGFEAVVGSKFADQLKGNAADNWLEAGGGDDWLIATAGNDVYQGGDGKDFIDYSAGAEGVYLILSSYTPTFQYNGTGYTGLATGHTYNNIEGVVGTAFTDFLYGGEGDQTFVGGKGNDYLAGAAGADTYVISRGDGYDTVTEDNTGWNVLSFGENIKFSDLWLGTAGGSGGWLDVGVRGDNAQFRVTANFEDLNRSKIKSLDLNGAGQLDVEGIEYAPAASDASEAVNGWANRRDLIVAYNGDDSITGSGGAWEDKGNVIIAGLGNDVITTSGGDDQFAYDRGDGLDSINDAGGEDTLVFGPTVAAEDVIYQVVGNHLYIGAKNPLDPNQTAYYVPDHVQIWNGGTKYVETDVYGQATGYSFINTVEYVIAGGTSIDLRKLDIQWTEQTYINYDYYYPIALDLDGDGLNMSSVEGSNVVVKTAQGGLSKIGWVGPTDGFLAVDRDGDGAINKLSEISFVQDKPGATSDLEGLRTWDTNGDGMLDKADKDFSRILLFVDANQNGRSTAKELRTLEQAGIAAINLGGTATGATRDLTTESFVQNTISFVWADGRTGQGYDVALARRVLGSEGLYAGDYQAEWGARDEDGTLGQLLNDPKTAAKAARIKAKKGLLDKLGATYAEVKAAAQVDFSDNDRIDATIARRWKKMDASQQAAWLSGQTSGMEGYQALAQVRSLSAEQSRWAAQGRGVQAGQDLVRNGLDQAAADLSSAGPQGPASDGQAAITGLGVDFTVAGGLGGVASSEPIDGLVAAGTAIGQDQAWWRGDGGGDLVGAGSLGALLAAMEQGPDGPALESGRLSDDPSLLRQQALLRQAMAGFGGETGGSAAIWNRDAVQPSSLLAAAGRTTSPAAANLTLAS